MKKKFISNVIYYVQEDTQLKSYLRIIGHAILVVLAVVGVFFIATDIFSQQKKVDILQLLGILANLSVAGATLFAALVALSGLHSWKSNLVETNLYDILNSIEEAANLVSTSKQEFSDKARFTPTPVSQTENLLNTTQHKNLRQHTALLHDKVRALKVKYPENYKKFIKLVAQADIKQGDYTTSVIELHALSKVGADAGILNVKGSVVETRRREWNDSINNILNELKTHFSSFST